MPRPSQEEKILEAALHVFALKGYDGTRIRQIAEVAAVSEGALYKHFPSKEAVAMALFTRYMRDYVQQLQVIAARPDAVRDRLQAIVIASLTAYRSNPDAIAYILIERPRLIEQLPADVPFPLTIISEIMREGQAQGIIRTGDPHLLAAIFLGCFLRPVIVSRSGDLHTLDLIHDTQHDAIISTAAWASVAAT